MIYDDVVTRESVTTPDMIEKTTAAWELSLNLAADGGSKRYIGTRYHFADTYHTLLERKSAVPRIYPATDNGEVDGEPVLLKKDALAEKRRDMGLYTFGCQMLQNPKADTTMGFHEKWLKFWKPSTSNLNIYILCDPASEKNKSSDYTVFMVVGYGGDQNYYVITFIRDKLNLAERTRTLLDLHRQYRPVAVGYEKYGMQSDIEHIKEIQAQKNYRFEIIELGGSMPKNDRIRRLVPIFEYGRIYIPEFLVRPDYGGRSVNLTQSFINDEYLAFPVSAHDDMLDCLARICDEDFPMTAPISTKQGWYKPNRRKAA
jgi:predicted phage terminase large subunit-like protein